MQEHVILLWQKIPLEISQPRLYNSNKLFLLDLMSMMQMEQTELINYRLSIV